MRKRPWEVIVLTVLYAAAPFFNLGYTMIARQVSPLDVFYLLMAFDAWDYAGLLADFVLAAAVWSVSRLGWWIFVVLNVFLFVLNLWQASQVDGANLYLVAGANLVNIAVASLLFTKHARSPYFSPRPRWWNAPTRFRIAEVLEVPMTITQGEHTGQGLVVDVSGTGCFAEVEEDFDDGQEIHLEFSCWGLTLASRGRIMRRSRPGERLQGYGIQFVGKDAEHRHSFSVLVKVLKAHKVPRQVSPA
jgi:hypothetical protein